MLLTEFKQRIQDLRLIPSGGGCFEVTVNGERIYSKLSTGQFPEEQAMLKAVQQRMK